MLNYSFVEFFDDMALWLLLGIALGGIVTAAVPLNTLNEVGGGTLISMLIMLVVGIPLYICASATTPVAAGLIASGLNPGAALVLLLVGPATNSGSLILLGRFLGKRTVLIYLGVVGLASLASQPQAGRTVAGTPAYMAPEQFAGEISTRSDIYALGLVLYELLTGQRPFEAESLAEFQHMHESDTPRNPSALVDDIDAAVESVILRCTSGSSA